MFSSSKSQARGDIEFETDSHNSYQDQTSPPHPSSSSTTTSPPTHKIQQSNADIRLPMAEVGLVNKRAQIQGTMMGIAGGLVTALATRHLLRQSSNITLATSLATGTSIGYFASRSSLQSGMLHLQEHKRILEGAKSNEMNNLDLQAGSQSQHEGGVAGMYNYQDRGHTTRGDH